MTREPLSRRLWKKLNGEEGAGLALSFVLHLILLAILAVPVINHLSSETVYTTIVQEASDDQVLLDAPIDTQIPMPVVESLNEDVQRQLLEVNDGPETVPELNLSDASSQAEATGTGREGNDVSGIRVAEPKTAIRAGNFSVWPWPFDRGRTEFEPRLRTPGDFPKAGQCYFIVIRARVPGERRSVPVSDFTGTVVGTDGYKQSIPTPPSQNRQAGLYYFNNKKQLVKATTGRRLPVIDGTVELFVSVPQALALVEDTVTVRSAILDEEQRFQLVFQATEN